MKYLYMEYPIHLILSHINSNIEQDTWDSFIKYEEKDTKSVQPVERSWRRKPQAEAQSLDNRADNPWRKVGCSSKKNIEKEFQGILNKMTERTFQKLTDDICAFEADSDIGKSLVQIMFNKIVLEPSFLDMYINLIKQLIEASTKGNSIWFNLDIVKIFLSIIKSEFERRSVQVDQENPHKHKRRIIGMMILISKLFNHSIIEFSEVTCYMDTLINSSDYSDIEFVCRLISEFNENDSRLSTDNKLYIDLLFKKLSEFLDQSNLVSRIRYSIMDILQNRDNAAKAERLANSKRECPVKSANQNISDNVNGRSENGSLTKGPWISRQNKDHAPKAWSRVARSEMRKKNKTNRSSKKVASVKTSAVVSEEFDKDRIAREMRTMLIEYETYVEFDDIVVLIRKYPGDLTLSGIFDYYIEGNQKQKNMCLDVVKKLLSDKLVSQKEYDAVSMLKEELIEDLSVDIPSAAASYREWKNVTI